MNEQLNQGEEVKWIIERNREELRKHAPFFTMATRRELRQITLEFEHGYDVCDDTAIHRRCKLEEQTMSDKYVDHIGNSGPPWTGYRSGKADSIMNLDCDGAQRLLPGQSWFPRPSLWQRIKAKLSSIRWSW